jgi:integrase
MLRYAEERGVLLRSPRIRLLKTVPPKFDFFTFEEFEQLLEAAREEPVWYAAFLVAGEAGLRRGEIIALDWDDVNFRSGNINVRRSSWRGVIGTPKSGRERVVPMTPRLAATLKAHQHKRGQRVFCTADGKPLTQGLTEWPLRRALKRAELRPAGWHVLRHTFCSHLASVARRPRRSRRSRDTSRSRPRSATFTWRR